jgi:hypothetical protein
MLAEKARLVLAIVVVGILVFSSLSSLLPNQRWTVVSTISTARADSTQTAPRNQVLDPAVKYLYKNYDESIGLNYVSPDTEELKNTYYIYSDNYLASLVLWNYDQSNLTLARRAGNITNQMHHYLNGTVNPINQYMALTESVFAFSNSKNFDLSAVDGAAIKTTINNQNGSLDPWNYADIAFLQAVYYHELGRENYAMAVYHDGVNLYDGKGFKDLPFLKDNSSNYQTYKLALYIYASKLLGQDYFQQAFDTLLAMQQHTSTRTNGGFNTSYNSTSLKATGYTNTETTSLAVLSLILQSPSSNSPMTWGQELTYILLVAGALSAALILVGVCLKIVRRRRV